MKIKVQHILSAILLLLAAVVIGFVHKLQKNNEEKLTCQGLDIEIVEPWHFVEECDIKEYVQKGYGDCIGKSLDSLRLSGMEKLLDGKSAVLKSQVWNTPDGILHIKVTQRKPVIRFQKGEQGFYSDDRGCLFPLQKGYTAQVPIIDGNVPVKIDANHKGPAKSEKEREWIGTCLEMVNAMCESKIWSENIAQISVDDNGDIIMVPRQGKEIFIFGGASNAKDKFERLGKYYSHIVPAKGKDYYKSVNVKYKHQIICRQDDGREVHSND